MRIAVVERDQVKTIVMKCKKMVLYTRPFS